MLRRRRRGNVAQKKKGNVTYCPRRRKKEINKGMCTWAFLSIKKKFILTQFSLHFREKIFWWAQGEKHLGATIYFPSSPPNQTHFKKVFLPIFFPKFFIHSISPPNKHTLRLENRSGRNFCIRFILNVF